MQAQLDRMEAKLDKLLSWRSEKKKEAVQRREQYKQAKERREKGKVSLPTTHVLLSRDRRISERIPNWASVGMKFGRADNPEGFLRWLCYQWNSCCYLKKPITFSGGYFKVHTGLTRHNYGPFDLMGYNRKQCMLLKNEGHHVDFRDRPWWTWAYHVLFPVYRAMGALPGFSELPGRFDRGVRLILGSYSDYEVYTDLCWDPCESRENVNRMFKRVGGDLRLMWRACCEGLRSKNCPAVPP